MLDVLTHWYRRYFTDPQAVILLLVLLIGFTVVLMMGGMLAPVFASLVVAYILDWGVNVLERWRLPRSLAVMVAFIFFMSFLLFILFGLLPLLWQQAATLINELPHILSKGQESLLLLPDQYPDLIAETQVREAFALVKRGVGQLGQYVFSTTIHILPSLIALIIYLIIVPLMVFFFLYDRDKILLWFTSRLPKQRALLTVVWQEVNLQLGNYVRGKVVEILVVGVATYAAFVVLQLNYALLLGAAVGISVLLPYVGAAVVTVPVAVVALLQFGWSTQSAYVMIVYAIIQALDGNVLVPLLFSEVVNLHPIAIITSILVFGGIWGLWGIFFSIPLAILLQAVMNAWPRRGAPGTIPDPS